MESKLVTFEKACTEAEWLKNLLVDLTINIFPFYFYVIIL